MISLSDKQFLEWLELQKELRRLLRGLLTHEGWTCKTKDASRKIIASQSNFSLANILLRPSGSSLRGKCRELRPTEGGTGEPPTTLRSLSKYHPSATCLTRVA